MFYLCLGKIVLELRPCLIYFLVDVMIPWSSETARSMYFWGIWQYICVNNNVAGNICNGSLLYLLAWSLLGLVAFCCSIGGIIGSCFFVYRYRVDLVLLVCRFTCGGMLNISKNTVINISFLNTKTERSGHTMLRYHYQVHGKWDTHTYVCSNLFFLLCAIYPQPIIAVQQVNIFLFIEKD